MGDIYSKQISIKGKVGIRMSPRCGARGKRLQQTSPCSHDTLVLLGKAREEADMFLNVKYWIESWGMESGRVAWEVYVRRSRD